MAVSLLVPPGAHRGASVLMPAVYRTITSAMTDDSASVGG